MAELVAFATAAQMEQRSQGEIPASTPFLDVELKAASNRIRNYCGWHIYPSLTVVDQKVRADYGHPIWLPTTLLTALDGITADSAVQDISGVDWWANGLVEFDGWCAPNLISYKHGYDVVPSELVDLTLALASGELLTRGVIREQTLASSVTWSRSSGQLTAIDEADLAVFKVGYQP